MNYCNVATNIEPTVNNFLGIWSILGVPNVNPYNNHVGHGRYLDYMWFGSKDYIVKQVIVFENVLNFIQQNMTVSFLTVEGNTYNLEVWFGLREPGQWNFICFREKWASNVFLNFLKVRTWRNVVSCNDDTIVLNSNEIGYSARFDSFESLIDVDDMWTWLLDEFLSDIIVH